MVSAMLIPLLILLFLCVGCVRKLPLYDLFVRGAKTGMHTAVQVLPNLAAMLCAISLMQASGLMDALCRFCAPVFMWLGLPPETAPLVLIRPLSGSGALAMLETLLDEFGPDSRIGLVACTVMGSGETIFYTMCTCMSGISNRETGYAVPCALLAAFVSTWLAGMLF